jgi:hypothetical protein
MAKLSNSNTALSAQSIVERADGLVKQREEFEQNEYARSNQRLYGILAEVYEMYGQVRDNKALLAATVKQLKATLERSKVRVQTNTLALSLFVRYVFRTDRQRSMNYCRALQAAFQQEISVNQLAQFIEDCGGVESCKKQYTKSVKVVTKETAISNSMTFVDEALAAANDKPLATFKVADSFVANTHNKDFVFVIGKSDQHGNIKALAAVPAHSAGMVKWAKQQLALFISQQNELAQQEAKAVRTNSAIVKATANVTAKAKNKAPTETVGDLLTA